MKPTEFILMIIGIVIGAVLLIVFIYKTISSQNRQLEASIKSYNDCTSINAEKIFEKVESCVEKGGKARQCQRYVKSTIC